MAQSYHKRATDKTRARSLFDATLSASRALTPRHPPSKPPRAKEQRMSDPEILCEREGSAGLITLNRPQALNALTLTMVRGMRRALDAWEADPRITRVV